MRDDKLEWDTILIVIFAIIALFLIVGCADKQKEAVYIPTKCKITMPQKPMPKDSTSKSVIEVLKYSESLEKDLEFCVNGSN